MKTTYTIYTSYHKEIFDWFAKRGTAVVITLESPYSYDIQFASDDEEVKYGRELRKLIKYLNDTYEDYDDWCYFC